MHAGGNSVVAFWLFLALQIIFVIIFAALARYDSTLVPVVSNSTEMHEGASVIPESKYPRE